MTNITDINVLIFRWIPMTYWFLLGNNVKQNNKSGNISELKLIIYVTETGWLDIKH